MELFGEWQTNAYEPPSAVGGLVPRSERASLWPRGSQRERTNDVYYSRDPLPPSTFSTTLTRPDGSDRCPPLISRLRCGWSGTTHTALARRPSLPFCMRYPSPPFGMRPSLPFGIRRASRDVDGAAPATRHRLAEAAARRIDREAARNRCQLSCSNVAPNDSTTNHYATVVYY